MPNDECQTNDEVQMTNVEAQPAKTPSLPAAPDARSAPPDYRRAPAVLVAAAFALGILIDHAIEPDIRVWLALLGICLIGWGESLRRDIRALSSVLLLSAVL